MIFDILLNIPLLMIIFFLGIAMTISYYFSTKKITFREYAIGDKHLATPYLVGTVLMTAWGGGALLRMVEQVPTTGLYWIVLATLAGFHLWIISPLAKRMRPFMQHLSIAETIGSVYGTHPRVVAALSGICFSVVGLAIEIRVMSLAIGMCTTSTDHQLVALLAVCALVFYAMFGGIQALTFVNLFQLVMFNLIIPILAWLMFFKTGKPVAALLSFAKAHPKFQSSNLFIWDTKCIGMLSLALAYLVSYINPNIMQRIYMCSSSKQAKEAFAYAGQFSLGITGFIMLIGLCIFVGAPDVPITGIWDYVVADLPADFKGYLILGLVAITLSTGESYVHACSVLAGHDILASLRGHQKEGVPTSDTESLRVARKTAVLVGLLATIVSLYWTDLLALLQLGFSFSIPIVTAPLLLAIYGFRGTSRTALIGMGVGAVSMVLWNLWVEPRTGIHGSFFCMIANGLAMLIAHYGMRQTKGTGWVKPPKRYWKIKTSSGMPRLFFFFF